MSTSRSSRSSGASVHPTRQQLDELDALLQRMLALPVNQVAEEDKETGRQGDKETRDEESSVSYSSEVVVPSREGKPAEKIVAGLEPRIIPDLGDVADPDEVAPLAVQPPHRLRERQPGTSSPPTRTEDESPEEPDATAEGDWIPLRSTWKPSAQTWPPLAETWKQAQHAPDTVRVRHDERRGPLREKTPLPDAEPSYLMRNAEHRTQEDESPYAEEPEPQENAYEPLERGPFSHVPEAEPEPAGPVLRGTSLRYVPRDPEPASPSNNEPPLPLFLLPLAWFNQGFDAVLSLLGPLGRGLCSRIGRNLLGALGILSLIGAFGLVVAHWLGWTW